MDILNRYSQWVLLKFIFVIGWANDKLLSIVEILQAFGETIIDGEATALLKAFPGLDGNVSFGAARVALDISQAMNSDLKGVAIQLGKALDDPSNCFPILSRARVFFTEEQRQRIVALVDTGQIVEAQRIILVELNKEYGDAERV